MKSVKQIKSDAAIANPKYIAIRFISSSRNIAKCNACIARFSNFVHARELKAGMKDPVFHVISRVLP